MLFPWCWTSFVLSCFVSVCVTCCFWICFVSFFTELFTLVLGCVMTGPVMLTETLPFFFQTRHKKGWSSLCSISLRVPQLNRRGPWRAPLAFMLSFFSLMCGNPENKKSYLPKKIIPESPCLMESTSVHILKILLSFPLFCMEDFYRSQSATNAGN